MVKKKKEPDIPKVKVKATRSDVKKRKENNKNKEFTCVKCSWNSFVKDNFLKTGIENIVFNINKIKFLSYHLLNYHFTRCLENNIELPEITQNLFYRACSVVSILKDRKSKEVIETDELTISFSHFKYNIDELPFRDKMGALINNLNKQKTMTDNHLKLNFYKRFHKYLELKTGETRKNVIYLWLKDIYAIEYSGKNPFIHFIRKWLKYPPTEVNIVNHSSHFIRVYYTILKEFEKYSNTKGIRTFNLLPNKRSFILDNIDICNTGLADIISYLTEEPNHTDFMKKKRIYWKELFEIETYETRNRKFAYGISTDGKSVSIRLQKPKMEEIKPKDIKKIQYEQLFGLDPGVRALHTSCNEEGDIIQTTTREYRHKSKMIYACKKRENWYKKWGYYEYWKKIPTFKTIKLNKMKSYLDYVLPKLNILFGFHKEKGFRGLKFRSYCRSKATLTEICKKIANGKKTLVGFGDYSQQHGLVKSHPTTPILKFKRELKKFCNVIDIDEYRTSKTCNACHKEITLYRNKQIRKDREGNPKKARMSNVYSVIRCSSNECKLCCMDRDINASKNILLLLKLQKEGKERLECFSVQPRKNTCDTPVMEDKHGKACNSLLQNKSFSISKVVKNRRLK